MVSKFDFMESFKDNFKLPSELIITEAYDLLWVNQNQTSGYTLNMLVREVLIVDSESIGLQLVLHKYGYHNNF